MNRALLAIVAELQLNPPSTRRNVRHYYRRREFVEKALPQSKRDDKDDRSQTELTQSLNSIYLQAMIGTVIKRLSSLFVSFLWFFGVALQLPLKETLVRTTQCSSSLWLEFAFWVASLARQHFLNAKLGCSLSKRNGQTSNGHEFVGSLTEIFHATSSKTNVL